MQVKHILSIFRFMLYLLSKVAEANAKDSESITSTINSLIAKREAAQKEVSRAKASMKKLKEFGI